MPTLIALAIVLCFLIAAGIALVTCVETADARAARAVPHDGEGAWEDER